MSIQVCAFKSRGSARQIQRNGKCEIAKYRYSMGKRHL